MKRLISGSWRRKRGNRKKRRMNVSEIGGRGRNDGVKRKNYLEMEQEKAEEEEVKWKEKEIRSNGREE
jgi:hypothetical protein